MNKKAYYFILFSFFLATLNTYPQGGELLRQQYSKGPELDSEYSRWYLKVGPQLNLINTDLKKTSPKIGLGAVIEFEYRISKTVGLVSGAQFTPISYSYSLDNFLSKENLKFINYPPVRKDVLRYISYPLMLTLRPTGKLSFGIAMVYQAFLNGEKHWESNIFKPIDRGITYNFNQIDANSVSFNYAVSGTKYYINYNWDKGNDEIKVINPYAKGIFKNSLGMVLQIALHSGKRITISGNYRLVKRVSPPLQLQTNNTSGFQLGILYRLWKSKLRP